MSSLVSTPRLVEAQGNRLSNEVKTFDDMRFHTQPSILSDLVSWRKIQPGDFFITKPSLKDGHGGIDTQCKEHLLSRSDSRSNIFCKIPGETRMGPVFEIKAVRIVGIHGIEVSVPSVKDCSRTFWVLISRGKNRFVNEIEKTDISHNVPSSNLLREQVEGENDSDDDERSFRKLYSTIDSSSSSKLETNPNILTEKPMFFTKKTILTQDRNWKIIPRNPDYSGWSLLSASTS